MIAAFLILSVLGVAQRLAAQQWLAITNASTPASDHASMSIEPPLDNNQLSDIRLEQSTSSIIDAIGDANPSYKDVVFAEVIQVGDGIQFNMTLDGTVPKVVEPGHFLQYGWYVDTDRDPATGDPHIYVGCEYEVFLANNDGNGWYGAVWVANQGEAHVAGTIFVHGNTISMRISKGQIGSPTAFNWEIYAISESGWDEAADSKAHTKLYKKPQAVNGIREVRTYPPNLTLRDGKTGGKVNVLALDVDDNPLSLKGRQVQFFSTQPAAAKVNNAGRVKGIGYGGPQIAARVDGVISRNTTHVAVGRFSLIPPVLHLSLIDQPIGRLTVLLENADGTPVSLAGKSVEFSSENDAWASVSNAGVVTAHSYGKELAIWVQVDGLAADNITYVRVSNFSLGLTMISLSRNNIVYEIAKQVGSYNYEKIFSDFEVVLVTDIAYQLEREACGTQPYNGSIQYMVNVLGHHDSEGTVVCGGAGNPCLFGTDVDTGNSCLIIASDYSQPQWAVIFHEMGHFFVGASQSALDFEKSESIGIYSEALATLAGFYAFDKIVTNASKYGLSDKIVASLQETFWLNAYLDALDVYIAAGAEFQNIDENIVDGILLSLKEKYSLSFWYRFFSVFLPVHEALEVELTTDAEVATYFVAACSAAARTDLRKRFRNEWGFPIEDSFFKKIYPSVQKTAAQRDPRARISADTVVRVGTTVILDGSGSYDPQGLPFTFTWSLTEKPIGSMAALSDPSLESPTFFADKVGNYKVALEVDNGLTTSVLEQRSIRTDTIPNTPKKLRAKALSWNKIKLRWKDSSNNELGFKIERREGGTDNWKRIGTVNANVKTYIDSIGLKEKTLYEYQVRAYNSKGPSAYTNIAKARTKKNSS